MNRRWWKAPEGRSQSPILQRIYDRDAQCSDRLHPGSGCTSVLEMQLLGPYLHQQRSGLVAPWEDTYLLR